MKSFLTYDHYWFWCNQVNRKKDLSRTNYSISIIWRTERRRITEVRRKEQMSSSQMKDQLSRELESIMLAKLRESPFFALYSPFAGLATTSTPFSHLHNNSSNNQNRHHHFLTIPRHDSGFQGKSRFKRFLSVYTANIPCLSSLPTFFLVHPRWWHAYEPVINHLILHTHLPVTVILSCHSLCVTKYLFFEFRITSGFINVTCISIDWYVRIIFQQNDVLFHFNVLHQITVTTKPITCTSAHNV